MKNSKLSFISPQEELDDIIKHGSKELFADDKDAAAQSRQIHYDEAAIDKYCPEALSLHSLSRIVIFHFQISEIIFPSFMLFQAT